MYTNLDHHLINFFVFCQQMKNKKQNNKDFYDLYAELQIWATIRNDKKFLI